MPKSPTYEKSFASHEKSKYWSKKNLESPRNIFKGTIKEYIFLCDDCNHEFLMKIYVIVSRGRWCQYCTYNLLCENQDCNFCLEKSFASHEKADFWSDKNTISPRNVTPSYKGIVWFDCDTCFHSFDTRLVLVTRKEENWCPFCSSKRLCSDENCDFCFCKSFACHAKSKYWIIDKNIFKPRELFLVSDKKGWFYCENCKHDFESVIKNITINSSWCPYCKNKKLCDDTKCTFCRKNSFSSHPRSDFWSEKNTFSPREIAICSGFPCIFDCEICKNEFRSRPIDIVVYHRWCPFCKNKTEGKLKLGLTKIYPELKHQFRIEWCRNDKNKFLPFDFVIKNLKIIIELDGLQHFKQVSNWKSPKISQETDLYKMDCANQNGYCVIRILQDDVWKDKFDWISEIDKAIKNLLSKPIIKNIYICKNNEYKIYTSEILKWRN